MEIRPMEAATLQIASRSFRRECQPSIQCGFHLGRPPGTVADQQEADRNQHKGDANVTTRKGHTSQPSSWSKKGNWHGWQKPALETVPGGQS